MTPRNAPTEYAKQLQLTRSLLIVASLQKRRDLKARQAVEDFVEASDWEPLDQLMVDREVWNYAVNRMRYEPRFVFCHPRILLKDSTTSLYYRGLSGMSIKIAKSYVGAVEPLEAGNTRARINDDKALRIARIYNTFICSVIKNSVDWTLENGYRTIVATLGITIDGSMRGKIGELAEQRIKNLMVAWLKSHELIESPNISEEQIIQDDLPAAYLLTGGMEMRFGADPDVSFTATQTGRIIAVIEIKGGTDPAGILERYGAAKKSFEHALQSNSLCKNFFISAVYTDEMNRRIENDRLVEKSFNIVSILDDALERETFFRELFHFALRLIP